MGPIINFGFPISEAGIKPDGIAFSNSSPVIQQGGNSRPYLFETGIYMIKRKSKMENFMKTRTKPRFCRFRLRIYAYGGSYYIDRVSKLERLLARTPRVVQIDMIGIGEIPGGPGIAVAVQSCLAVRGGQKLSRMRVPACKHGAVLVWRCWATAGSFAMTRAFFFRRTELSEEEQAESHAGVNDVENKYKDSFSEVEPEEGDHLQVLQFINEFLPVKELAGRLIALPVLRQFGIVESEHQDDFLATAFSKSDRALAFR